MTEPIVLKDIYKQSTRDLDKTLPPEETVRRFKRKIEEMELKILDEVVRIDNGRLDIPVYMSYCGPDAEKVTGAQIGRASCRERV